MRSNLAIELITLRRFPDAVREAEEVLRRDPTVREMRIVAACGLDSLGRHEEAARCLRRWTRGDLADRMGRVTLVQMLMRLSRFDAADSVAQEGMLADPSDLEWTGWAAKSAQAQGRLARAIPLWREVVARSPVVVDAPMNLAYCLLANGDFRGARDAYTETLRRSPDSAAAANGLAWALLELGEGTDEAVRRAEEATAKEPVGAYLDTLARAYLAAGRCVDARRAITRALALDPGNRDYLARREEIRARCR